MKHSTEKRESLAISDTHASGLCMVYGQWLN